MIHNKANPYYIRFKIPIFKDCHLMATIVILGRSNLDIIFLILFGKISSIFSKIRKYIKGILI